MAAVAALSARCSQQAAARSLRVPVKQVAAWQRSGLVGAGVAAADRSVSRGELLAMRRLRDLRAMQLSTRAIRRASEAMRQRAGLSVPLEESTPLRDGPRLLFRHGDALLDPLTQQLLFDFGGAPAATVTLMRRGTAASEAEQQMARAQEIFQRAVLIEDEPGMAGVAADLYREALSLWPGYAAAFINLGTILYNGQRFAEAEGCYRAAAEIDPDYALAFFDLGNVLDELQRLPEAITAYERAIHLLPAYADAHYNLALALEREGLRRRALRHWMSYLRLDPVGPWAAHARGQVRRTLASESLRLVPAVASRS